MLTLLLYCVPTILYVVWRTRQGDDRREAIADAGAVPGTGRDYLWGLALIVPIALVGWVAGMLLPATTTRAPLSDILAPTTIALTLVGAAGTEILFRGLLGGVLMRRLGMLPGNTVQAAISMLLSLTVLLTDARLWPLVIAEFVVAWLLGALRARLGTCFPGILAAGLGQLAAAALLAG